MYTGKLENVDKGPGLLSYCGQDSEKHSGQLKRIAGPTIGLLKWLLTNDIYDTNIFHDRFTLLSPNEYLKINFIKHIQNVDNKTLPISSSRQGKSEDAYYILAIALRDHRNSETSENESLSVNSLLNDKQCKEKFNRWLQRTNSEQV